jgi:hypothetical protein
MPYFVNVYESIYDPGFSDDVITDSLNGMLYSLQNMGAKISDIKVSICNLSEGIARTYLVIYEAEKPLSPKEE